MFTLVVGCGLDGASCFYLSVSFGHYCRFESNFAHLNWLIWMAQSTWFLHHSHWSHAFSSANQTFAQIHPCSPTARCLTLFLVALIQLFSFAFRPDIHYSAVTCPIKFASLIYYCQQSFFSLFILIVLATLIQATTIIEFLAVSLYLKRNLFGFF